MNNSNTEDKTENALLELSKLYMHLGVSGVLEAHRTLENTWYKLDKLRRPESICNKQIEDVQCIIGNLITSVDNAIDELRKANDYGRK